METAIAADAIALALGEPDALSIAMAGSADRIDASERAMTVPPSAGRDHLLAGHRIPFALMGAIAFGRLGWLNKAAGAVAGLFLGCVLVALTVKVLSEYGGPTGAELLSPSALAPSLLQFWVAVTELAQR